MSALAVPAPPLPPAVEARLVAALGLARQGFAIAHVYGVHPDGRCSCGDPHDRSRDPRKDAGSVGKHGGKGWLEQATTDPEVIHTRFLQSSPNYGVVPPVGSGLIIVDEDVPGSLDALGALPPTLTVQTGLKPDGSRGRHVYGKLPAGIDEADVPYRWSGGEVRVHGNGQVVGPYSRHHSGVAYEPLNGSRAAELPEAWVRALIASGRHETAALNGARSEADPGWYVAEPGRHPWLVSKARHLRGIGLSGDRLRAELRRLNTERCRPPKAEAEVDEIAGWTNDHIGDDAPEPNPERARNLEEPSLARATPKSIGNRTALDLSYGPPLPQLADPFLTPEGVTVLYGRGGVGKGITACWFALRLVRAGHIVMVIDFEGHEREWGSRLRGLGLTDAELSRVHYRAPFGPDWTAEKGTLSRVAALVRDDADRLGVTYIVVDSYSVATSNGDTMGGEAAAREFFTGMTTIGTASLVIAHVAGASGKFPDRPFGSVFIHNLSRETWAVEPLGDEESDDYEPDLIRFGPHVVALELRNRKSNGRPKARAQFVTFSFFGDGTIEATTDGPSARTVADMAADALADGPLTIPKIVTAIREDTGQAITADTLRTVLKRHPQRFAESPTGRPRTWDARR